MTETTAAPRPARAAPQALGARPAVAPRARRRRRTLGLLGFAAPAALIYGVFLVLPTLAALLMSVTNWNGVDYAWEFVGTANYRRLAADPLFRESVGTNVEFTLIVLVAQTGLSLGLALLLVRNSPGTIFYRALYFTPTIIASVSVAIAWILMYDPQLGAVNELLTAVGLDGLTRSWLGDRAIAIRSLAVIQFWQHTGQVMIVFIAGLQAIPRELVEAASVEGASAWQRFRHVVLPLLAPSTTIVVAYTTIQSFRAFDLVLALTDGGPANATEIISTWIYHSAFRNYEFGYASAGAVLFLVVLGGLTWLQFRLLRVET
jgi:raffinose/stachyose/melibiose transport system permease protein